MRSTHKYLSMAGLVILILALALSLAACGEEETVTTAAPAGETETTATAVEGDFAIGVTQIVSHPALDSVVEGFREALTEAGYVEGQNVTYDLQNAQGDMANASSIAQKFSGDNVDLILAIATPTSQAAVKATTSIPVVFAAVTDPLAAGLVDNADAPGANVTGVSDMLPIEPHLELIKQLVPEAKTIGLLYNAGETNSVTLVEKEKAAAEAMGFQVVEATASNSSEVLAAAQSLVGRADVISVLTDNTIVSALESVVKVCQENKIPLISGDIDSVERGSVAAYAFDYKDHGRQAGMIAIQILKGTPISQIAVQYAENLQLAINLAAAEAMGVTIPEELKSKASKTF